MGSNMNAQLFCYTDAHNNGLEIIIISIVHELHTSPAIMLCVFFFVVYFNYRHTPCTKITTTKDTQMIWGKSTTVNKNKFHSIAFVISPSMGQRVAYFDVLVIVVRNFDYFKFSLFNHEHHRNMSIGYESINVTYHPQSMFHLSVDSTWNILLQNSANMNENSL